MSSRYTRRDFEDAGIYPSDCDRIIGEEAGDDTPYMACDYHEGWIDGCEATWRYEGSGR